ncbi:hypothetical protein G9A89_017310 [Geosiphon pyriformis]|nr:hypothetical protein G9A89_017310 [Geosiphon pyriformis]
MAATQCILNIASKFFHLNDISINTEKIVAIPINHRVKAPYLTISGLDISIAKKGKAYRYLEIFLSTDDFSKPSFTKTQHFWQIIRTQGDESAGHQLDALATLSFSVVLLLNSVNSFLAGITNTLASCKLSLNNVLPNVFQAGSGISVADILGLDQYISVNGGLVGGHVLASDSASGGCRVSLSSISEHLFENISDGIVVYTDGLIKDLGFIDAYDDAAAYFLNINNDMRVGGHSGVYGNECANLLANAVTSSDIVLPVETSYHFLFIEKKPVSKNACYFVRCLFDAMSFVSWKAKCVAYVVKGTLYNKIDMQCTFSAWHSDDQFQSGFTSYFSACF